MISDYLKTLILDTNARYYGISILDLMERAGRGVADFITKKFGKNKKVAVFCGLGNNGGDGFVAARYLCRDNDIAVFLVGKPEEIKTEEAKINFQNLKTQISKLKTTTKNLKLLVNLSVHDIVGVLARARFDVVVDALFGVGVKGKLKEPYTNVIRLMNKMPGKKVAVDNPSPGFKVDYTVSMHYPKIPGAYVTDIGLKEVERKVGPGEVKALYKPPADSHKGQNGQLMIIAGGEHYHGAPLLATKMASKIVDLVFFSSVPENSELVRKMRSKLCEFIVVPARRSFGEGGPQDEVGKFIKRCDAILLGPGMGMIEETKNITNRLLKKYPDKKFVLDADALKLVNPRLLGENCILTPHAGEFQVLFKIRATPQNVAKMAKKYGCVIVLKGPVDIICDGKGDCKKDYAGNAGLTKGGTGDVLAGLVAALACKNDLFLAACAGTFLLGLAGERLFKKVSYYYNPSDLILEIPKVMKWCKDF